jgi:hypothetical protein
MAAAAGTEIDDATLWKQGPVRDTVFVGLVALIVVFVGLTVRGGLLPGVLGTACGVIGLALRAPAMPVLFVAVLSYLFVFPFGVPGVTAGFGETRGTAFRVTDLVLIAAAVVYLVCQYRALGLTVRAMPADTTAPERSPVRRPSSIVPENELGGIVWVVAGAVLAGQVAWVLLTAVGVDLRAVPPLTVTPGQDADDEFVLPPTGGRLLLFLGLTAGTALVARFAFWYWRLARLTKAEGDMILLDTGWREARREINRQAKWAAWARPDGRYTGPAEPVPPISVWGWVRRVFVGFLLATAVFVVARAAILLWY